jgi:hypothetical protein
LEYIREVQREWYASNQKLTVLRMGAAKRSTIENKKVSDFFMRSHNKSDYHIFAVTLTSTNCSSTTQFKLNVQLIKHIWLVNASSDLLLFIIFWIGIILYMVACHHMIMVNRIGGVMVSVLASSAVDCVLDQHAELDFYSSSSLKQQSAGRHIAPLGYIILIPSQPVFALSP